MPIPKQKIDDYIKKLPPSSKEICIKLRSIVHKAGKNIVEDWKWGPNFQYKGMVCGVWGFKNHASIVFFKGALMKDTKKLFNDGLDNQKGRTIQFTDTQQIKEKELISYIKEAIALNIEGKKIPSKGKPKTVTIPANIKNILVKKNLMDAYNARPPYQRRDYILWIQQAKQEATRQKRLDLMLHELEHGGYMKMKYKN